MKKQVLMWVMLILLVGGMVEAAKKGEIIFDNGVMVGVYIDTSQAVRIGDTISFAKQANSVVVGISNSGQIFTMEEANYKQNYNPKKDYTIDESILWIGSPGYDKIVIKKAPESESEPEKTIPPTEPEPEDTTPTPSSPVYNSLADIQLALKDKKITHGQAYEEAAKIAKQEADKFKKTKEVYDQKLQNLGTGKIDKEGKIPPTVAGNDLDVTGKVLGFPQRPPEGRAVQNFKELKVGDRLYLNDDDQNPEYGNIKSIDKETGEIEWVAESNQNINVIFTPESHPDIASKMFKPISDDEFRKQQQTLLDSQKPNENNAKAAQTFAESIEWQGTWLDAMDLSNWYSKGEYSAKKWGAFISGGFQAVASLGEYRALSNLLFPETTEAWSEWANSETLNRWASLPSTITADLCVDDDTKRANRPGQTAVFITTSAGTHQSVGAASAERSPAKFPIICTKDKDDEWTCPKNLVCNDNTFCFKDKSATKPEEGYFYKITWAVKAPADEKFTRFVDEAGNAAKFNVYLVGPSGDLPLYTRKGITDPKKVIQLVKGDSDGGMIIRYLPGEYSQVCVRFADDGYIKDRDGDDIHEFCNSVTLSEGGVTEYAQSARFETIASTSAEVELNI